VQAQVQGAGAFWQSLNVIKGLLQSRPSGAWQGYSTGGCGGFTAMELGARAAAFTLDRPEM
jgi:hypothetical protein